jgi:hypothetical protein
MFTHSYSACRQSVAYIFKESVSNLKLWTCPVNTRDMNNRYRAYSIHRIEHNAYIWCVALWHVFGCMALWHVFECVALWHVFGVWHCGIVACIWCVALWHVFGCVALWHVFGVWHCVMYLVCGIVTCIWVCGIVACSWVCGIVFVSHDHTSYLQLFH